MQVAWVGALAVLFTSVAVATSSQFGDRAFGSVHVAVEELTDPENSAFFIMQFVTAFLAVETVWIVLHLLLWDYNDTTPEEELSINKQINFFTDPDKALENVLLTMGMATATSVFFLIPTLFWRGEPLPETKNELHLERAVASNSRLSPEVIEHGNFPMALRRILCPNCVLEIFLVNALITASIVAYWSISPYFREPEEEEHEEEEELLRRRRYIHAFKYAE